MSQQPSELIDQYIAGLNDWRGELLASLRRVINAADPRLKEDWKWDVPIWTASGNVCALAAFKDSVKVNFMKGASLPDPHGLFNGGLSAKASRSIDIAKGDQVDEGALRDLVREAVAHNAGGR